MRFLNVMSIDIVLLPLSVYQGEKENEERVFKKEVIPRDFFTSPRQDLVLIKNLIAQILETDYRDYF